MQQVKFRYAMPERRGSRLQCPALKRWISDRDCEIRRTTPYCVSCNGCPLKADSTVGCASCGQPYEAKSQFQLYCSMRCKRDATNKKRLMMRHRWKNEGLCIYCGKLPVQAGRSHLGCQACLDMHSQARKVRNTDGPDAKPPTAEDAPSSQDRV